MELIIYRLFYANVYLWSQVAGGFVWFQLRLFKIIYAQLQLYTF